LPDPTTANAGFKAPHAQLDRNRYLPPMFTASASRGPDVRFIICSLVLAAFLWLVKNGLYSALDAYGFWPFMALCGSLTMLIIAAAFAWDRHEARR
jgi:hypothetical protein